jgi:hypothetical protein
MIAGGIGTAAESGGEVAAGTYKLLAFDLDFAEAGLCLLGDLGR